MRGRICTACAVSILALTGVASSEILVSRPVGFTRVQVPAGENILLSSPFESLDLFELEEQLSPGETIDTADMILKWDPAAQEYDITYVLEGETNSANLGSGEGFAIASRQDSDRVVYLLGEVVFGPSNQLDLCPGLNLIGYPYSTPIPWSETTLLAEDIIESGAQTEVGKGYWYELDGDECEVWTEMRPYEDLFSSETSVVEITGIEVVGQTSICLWIETEASTVDIFYQDMSPTGRFETLAGWRLAEGSIPRGDTERIFWLDNGTADREPAASVESRYYLIGRADIDLDHNGIPDARDALLNGVGPGLIVSSALIDGGLYSSGEGTTNGFGTGSGETNSLAENLSSNVVPIEILWKRRVIYVDRARGSDSYSGEKALSVAGDGPKRTISGGLEIVREGDLLIVKQGTYAADLPIAGRDIRVVISGKVRLSGERDPGPNVPVDPYPPGTVNTNKQESKP